MKLVSQSFADGQPLPGRLAYCRPASVGHVALAGNRNPHLAWSEAPAGTRSFALICHDPDVPSRADDVNREGRVVPADLPRVDFFHWVLVDVPPSWNEIAEGAMSDGVVARGKAALDGAAPRHGVNDYTAWFRGDQDMEGRYHGYDGPCPPWNDALVHRYVFTVYALDVEHLPLGAGFGGVEARAALAPHVLASASISGTYTLNPALLDTPPSP